MKQFLPILIFLFSYSLIAQSTISGNVTNSKGVPIVGANAYLEGTYDGSTTNDKGEFLFITEETGTQTLIVSYLSYETFTMVGNVSFMKDLQIKLRDDVNVLDAVVLSAGTFHAGDNSKCFYVLFQLVSIIRRVEKFMNE
ncbi:MAG: hypothetical protein DRI75_13395 [Bacteroidetes bacterium]|nr:MAG: hypothetical protein DRI75_13395 [Bacteroidota bacterium]